jgi:hypothetical protein
MIGYKLFRKRKDGTYGPLFINRSQKILQGETYHAEDHPTKGYAYRPGSPPEGKIRSRMVPRAVLRRREGHSA